MVGAAVVGEEAEVAAEEEEEDGAEEGRNCTGLDRDSIYMLS